MQASQNNIQALQDEVNKKGNDVVKNMGNKAEVNCMSEVLKYFSNDLSKQLHANRKKRQQIIH